MKKNYLILIVSTIIVIAINQTVQAQTDLNSTRENQSAQTQSAVNFTKLFEQKYPDREANALYKEAGGSATDIGFHTVFVEYESPTTILIRGDLIGTGHKFNSDVWNALDFLKNQHGFKLQQVMTSGVGSEGNPTVVYILMTK